MAFTNPILAGEELNRTGIKSENYVPSVSGWRIANNGAAEFDNIGVRGNLWVPSITLGGQDLAALINKAPKGVLCWVRGQPATATTTEAAILWGEFDMVPGRFYEICCVNITPDLGNTKATEYHLRIEVGTTIWPTNTSFMFSNSLRVSPFELATIRHFFAPVDAGRLRLRVSIASLDGATVRNWFPGEGSLLTVIDHGIATPQLPATYVGATSPGGKVTKEWTITANASKTYLGTGVVRPTDAYATTLVAGDFANGRGNQRAWWTFSASDIGTYLNDLIGVPLADIITAEVRLCPVEYQSLTNSAWLSLGYHNQTSVAGSNEPGGGIPNVYNPLASGFSPQWFNIKPTASPSNFLDSMRDGYLKGFMVGNTYSGQGYTVVCEGYGTGSNPPQLHVKYLK
jgi:hypothetical protein